MKWMTGACCNFGQWILVFVLKVILSSVLAVAGYGEDRALPVSVCDVFSSPEKYQGHLALVQGELLAGQHGMELYSQKCGGISDKVRTAICVVTTSDPLAPTVRFRTDSLPIVTLATAERILREHDTGFKGVAVMEGQLFVAPAGSGFCHINQYRILLVAKELLSYSTRRREVRP